MQANPSYTQRFSHVRRFSPAITPILSLTRRVVQNVIESTSTVADTVTSGGAISVPDLVGA